MNRNRARLAFAASAAAVLAAVVVAVALSGSSGDRAPADACLVVWNDDPVALSDGAHAYGGHGYRATLLARVDPNGALVTDPDVEATPTAQARCAVIFASPQVEQEPDFGVRVYDDGRWTGLAASDRVPLDQIAELQRDATETANVTLLPDGRLAD